MKLTKSEKLIPMAICYDFDGTLSPKNMQEVAFIPLLKMEPAAFWKQAREHAEKHQMDDILAYMQVMLIEAQKEQVGIRKKDFQKYGKRTPLFKGVDSWFSRINSYGKRKRILIKHYIISSGLKEMIEGTQVAQYFSGIFASSFQYAKDGKAIWPAVAINYTTKTQWVFRINKGCLDINDNQLINQNVPLYKRSVPFENIVYIGDGETDVPCMRLVKKEGGHSIAVYKPRNKQSKNVSEQLFKDDRVNAFIIADYSSGKKLDLFIKDLIDRISKN